MRGVEFLRKLESLSKSYLGQGGNSLLEFSSPCKMDSKLNNMTHLSFRLLILTNKFKFKLMKSFF